MTKVKIKEAAPTVTKKEQALKYLRDHPGSTTDEIATAISCTKKWAKKILEDMRIDGAVNRFGTGVGSDVFTWRHWTQQSRAIKPEPSQPEPEPELEEPTLADQGPEPGGGGDTIPPVDSDPIDRIRRAFFRVFGGDDEQGEEGEQGGQSDEDPDFMVMVSLTAFASVEPAPVIPALSTIDGRASTAMATIHEDGSVRMGVNAFAALAQLAKIGE